MLVVAGAGVVGEYPDLPVTNQNREAVRDVGWLVRVQPEAPRQGPTLSRLDGLHASPTCTGRSECVPTH